MGTILIPCIQRKEYPEIVRQSYLIMGVCSINYLKDFNYLRLFFDNISKNINEKIKEFKDFDLNSLLIIFDSFLNNDIKMFNFG